MTAIELARMVTTTRTAHLFRPKREGALGYDAREYHVGGNKRGWVLLDLFSASAIVAVYDALNEANRARYATMPPQRAAVVAFKLVK